jgi:hypothetical protein
VGNLLLYLQYEIITRDNKKPERNGNYSSKGMTFVFVFFGAYVNEMAAGRRKNKEIIMRRGIGLLYFSSHIPEVKGNMVRVPIQQQELCTTFPSSTFATASASLSVIL